MSVGGLVGGRLFVAAVAKQWTTTTGQHVGNFALALGIYWTALSLGGNGFIAAFVGRSRFRRDDTLPNARGNGIH